VGTPKQIGGIGLMAYNDKVDDGIIQTTGYYLTYGHTFHLSPISPDVIAIGVQGGYDITKVDYSTLAFVSQYNQYINSGFDPTRSNPVNEFNEQSGAFVLNAGFMYYYNPQRNYLLYNYSAFSGFSFTNLNQPNKSLSKFSESPAPIYYKYHGGVEFKYQKMYIIPSVLVNYVTKQMQFNVGTFVTYGTELAKGFSLSDRGIELVGGIWYRYKDSFIFLLGINDDNYSLKISYDLNEKLLGDQEQNDLLNPAMEISLKYVFGRANRIRKISNPLF
jgi:type IX secretion system PorP/SprF family membrane protein